MGRISGYYVWDDDDLSPGHKKEGGLHQNLFDDEGKLKGHARFVPVDGDELDSEAPTDSVFVSRSERLWILEDEELKEAIVDLLVVVIEVGIRVATPRVQGWWQEKVQPFANLQWSRLRKRLPRGKTADVIAPGGNDHHGLEIDSLAIREGVRPRMSRAEAQARIVAAMAARAYSDEQMRMVAEANIVDAEDLAEIRAGFAQLPREAIIGVVQEMISDPSLLSEGNLAVLAGVLAREPLASPRESHLVSKAPE